MKKKQARFRIFIFYILILAPAVVWGLLSLCGLSEKLDVNTGEKRNKHEMAADTTLASLTQEAELYYNDRVPFRSVILKMNSTLNWAIELPYKNGIEPGLIAIANAGKKDKSVKPEETQTAGTEEKSGPETPDAVTESVETSESEAVSEPVSEAAQSSEDVQQPEQISGSTAAENNTESLWDAAGPYYEEPSDAGYYPYIELAPEVIQGRDGWIFTSETLADYIGSNIQPESELADFTGKLDTLTAICAGRNIQVYYMAVPNKATVYPEYMPTLDKTDYCALQQLEDYIHANSSSVFEYIEDEMLAAKRYGQLYFKTDTHWNGTGAMAGLSALHRILGLEELDIRLLVPEQGAPVDCDLVWYTGLPAGSFETEYNVEYSYKSDIPVNMIQGQTDTVDEFVSGAPDGRTLVYIGDSYRHNIMPYLIKDFAHVYFINEKILTSEHLDILNSADILFIEGVERNFFLNFEAQKVLSDLLAILG